MSASARGRRSVWRNGVRSPRRFGGGREKRAYSRAARCRRVACGFGGDADDARAGFVDFVGVLLRRRSHRPIGRGTPCWSDVLRQPSHADDFSVARWCTARPCPRSSFRSTTHGHAEIAQHVQDRRNRQGGGLTVPGIAPNMFLTAADMPIMPCVLSLQKLMIASQFVEAIRWICRWRSS